MFMRETKGVYQFGTKRVAVKVEKQGIKIRVGGGYLSIDESQNPKTPSKWNDMDYVLLLYELKNDGISSLKP